MKIAIDKTIIDKIEKKEENEYLYIYDKEPLQNLLKTHCHCIHKDYIEEVDINLTKYDIDALKATTIEEKNWDKIEKKEYKFAIIVPNYNNDHGIEKSFLRKCIESILNQTYKNFELIIIDDMSTDTSIETIKSYIDDRIVLIQNSRKRFNGGSRNVGIEYALKKDFDYITFLDSDDWYKNEKVLQTINDRLENCDIMLLGLELLFPDKHTQIKYHEYHNYEDFFLSDNKVWCTAWSRVIKKDKIVFFPEDTLMEDRTWSYEQADNIKDLSKVKNLKKVCYVWNRTNTTNSVSLVRGKLWEASAWKHIGQQYILLTKLKHKEMTPLLEERIEECKRKIKNKIYQQY